MKIVDKTKYFSYIRINVTTITSFRNSINAFTFQHCNKIGHETLNLEA